MHSTMDFDLGLLEALNRVAVESVIAGRLPAEAVLPGVRALDLWSEGPNGAMLLWVERGAHGLGEPELHDVIVTRVDGTWRLMGGASSTMEPWEDLLDRFPPGLHRVGGSSASQRPLAPVFVTWAIATPEVALVRLRNTDGGVRERVPGRHGFVMLGVTSEDPLTSVYAVNQAGEELPGEPLMLWAPPRDTAING
jgi:hypothetical protein